MDGATLLQAVSSFVVNLAFAILIGALCTRRLLRGGAWQADGSVRDAIVRVERWAALSGAIAAACALWAAAAVMGGVGPGEGLSMLGPTLGTAYGHAGLLGLAAWIAAALLALPPRRGLRVDALLALALLTWSAARVSVSHAGEEGLFSLGVLVEWLHLVLVALWLGLVALAGMLVLPRVRLGWPGMAQLSAYLEQVSTLATVALAGILATGIYNSWHRLGSLDQLFGNLYGNALAVKLALVALAVALGGYNKLSGFPGLAASLARRGPVLTVLRVELVILVGALAAAVVLISNQPPGG